MTQFLWGLTAAIPAVICEYWYRTLEGSWFSNLLYFLPLNLLISYSVYRLVTTPNTSLLDAFIIWAVIVTILRAFVSVVILKDTVGPGTWAAVALVIVARTVQTLWK